jgi:hypothetical protein
METTIKSILDHLKDMIQRNIPVSAGEYLDAAQKLAILLSDLDNELVGAEIEYRELQARHLVNGESAAAAEILARASPAYKRLLELRAERERITWAIQISKKRVELHSYEQ